eukprot:Seg3236.1 transcript_id=Seg3236.1/GoldUCD/mRNA.D3Y31 product="Synapse-associated protein 1" protein_id=Seg3236.1/GoldUCD/D3Y31
MFSWFGSKSEDNEIKNEAIDPKEDEDINKPADDPSKEDKTDEQLDVKTAPPANDGPKSQSSGYGSLTGAMGLFNTFASAATKTAHKLKESVDEKLDKTIIGEFQRENDKFVKERHSKRTDDPVPPWVGYNEEEEMKTQIMSLSTDERNFLRDPPSGVDFHFDLDAVMPVALTILREDKKLQDMRFKLVPKKMKEDKFWRNYFYRVSLIKQSSQLSTLAQSDKNNSDSSKGGEKQGSSPREKRKDQPEDDKKSTTDAPDKTSQDKKDSDSADWEKELQDELQDFEFVSEDQSDVQEPNPEWEKEIENMLGLEDEDDQSMS